MNYYNKLSNNVHCWGCKYYQPPYDGDYSLEGFTPPEPMMCEQPELMALSDKCEEAAVLIETIMFQLSALNNCPFKTECNDDQPGSAGRRQ